MKKVILDNKYELGGGLGSWAKSIEKNVKVGDVRVIGQILMYAYIVYMKSWPYQHEVHWIPVDSDKNEMDKLNTWVKNV